MTTDTRDALMGTIGHLRRHSVALQEALKKPSITDPLELSAMRTQLAITEHTKLQLEYLLLVSPRPGKE